MTRPRRLRDDAAMAPSLPRLARMLVVAGLVGGCGPTTIGDGPSEDGSSSAQPSTGAADPTTTGASTSVGSTAGDGPLDASDGEPTTATAGSSTGPDVEGPCPDVPGFECSMPFDCSFLACTALVPFDEQGCMRPPCTGPEGCAADQFCFLPYESYGVCTSSGMSCSDGPDGTCECVSTPDCGGGYCMTDCTDLSSDREGCEAAGCDFTTVVGISETCECIPDVPLCLQGPGGVGGIPSFMWHEQTLEVAYFFRPWDVPLRWHPCTEPGSPPACACNDPFLPPTCP